MSTKSMSFSKRLFAGILLSASLLLFGTFAGTSSAAALGDERDVSVESDITATSAVTLDNTDVKMKVGKTAALTAAVTPPDAADKTVTWSSSNTSVASVTNTGVVTAVSEGTADITASSNGSTAKCKITVMAAPLKNTSVVSKSITFGDTINISASASGGTAPYKYTYYYKKASSASWVKKNAANTVTSTTVRPGAAAVYNIKVVVTDSKGSIAESYSDVAVNPTELKNTSTVSDEISLGDFINISASASGGTEPYTYSYYYKKSSSNSWTAKFKDSALPSVTVKPGSVTNYDIKVIVKDDENNTAEKTFSVKVNPAPLVNTSTVSESITLGESIEIKGSAAGGTAPYKYEYFFKQETKTEWSKKNVDNTTSATTVKPGSAVPYNIKVVVTDSDGKTAEKTYSVKVNPAPLVNTSTVSESITLGESIEIKGSAAGGTAPYKYEYFFKQETKTEWSKKNVDNTTSATTVKPGSAVPYNVKVVVTDLAGKTAEKIFSVEVKAKPEPLVNTSTVSNTITLGENIEIIGSAAGGTAPYTYEYYFKQVKNDVWSKKNVSNTTTSTTIKPGSAVPYNIKVVVKDSKGETAERIYHVNVNEPEEEEVYYTYYFLAPDNYFKTEAGAENDKVGIYWWEPEEVKIWPGVEAVKAPEIGENVYKYVGISSEAAHIIFNEFYIGGQQTIDINTEGYHGDCPYDASIETDNFDGWIYVMNNDDIIEHPKFTGVMTTNGAWFKLDQYKDYKEYYGSYDFAKK